MKKLFVLIAMGLVLFTGAQTISEKEKAGILRMREEEKMARDIYRTLNEKWNQRVFSNILKSETYHMERMKTLIDKFQMQDPVAKTNDKAGIFENKTLQKMYDELTASGSANIEAAFRAGAKVEEADIKDLREAIALTSNNDIKSTYEYLVQASENHLRAFVRNLNRVGIVYEPIVLSKDEYSKIINDKQGKKGPGRNNW